MPINLDSFPMRLFERSQARAWRPAEIDYSREARDWLSLDDSERTLLLRLVAGFYVGERGVTHDLGPLQFALRQEKGRIDEEMFVTAQMFEEARHVEFFERWLQATLPGVFGTDIPYPDLSGDLFGTRLREVMGALLTDQSPRAQIRASMIYHLYIEGVGAEAAYPLYFDICEKRALFPGLLAGIRLIRRDEARHIAFGTYLTQRLLDENPELEGFFTEEFESYRGFAAAGADQTFAPFLGGERVPFDLDPEHYRGLYLQRFELMRRSITERLLYEAAEA